MDEASQVEDLVAELFLCGYRELPQKPALAISADYQQLREVGHAGRKSVMQRLSEELKGFHLTANYRTDDEDLKAFLRVLRVEQPQKSYLQSFFRGRHLQGPLQECLRWTLSEGRRRGVNFTWLCVTNPRGVRKVNLAALRALPQPASR